MVLPPLLKTFRLRMATQTLNSLSKASSAYLRSAMHQPIQWNEWGEEAFATAQRENKPILLDIGAVWCHWCHVMDRESYDDPEVAQIVNERFVAVKVDRDERPDIDSRYQVGGERHQRAGRLAADRLSHSRRQAVLRRHLLSSRRKLRTSQFQARAAVHRRRLSRRKIPKWWSRRRWWRSRSPGPSLSPAAAASSLPR